MKTYTCSRCCKDDLLDWQVFETGWPNRIRYWCQLTCVPRIALWQVSVKEWWACKRGRM